MSDKTNKHQPAEIATAIIRGVELVEERMKKEGLLTDETTWHAFIEFGKSMSPIDVGFGKKES